VDSPVKRYLANESSSATFDVLQVDATMVQLEGLAVRVVWRQGNLQAHIEDVNGDGFTDMTATLTATLFNGTRIAASDAICIVPNQ
jgi:hypothetical protein